MALIKSMMDGFCSWENQIFLIHHVRSWNCVIEMYQESCHEICQLNKQVDRFHHSISKWMTSDMDMTITIPLFMPYLHDSQDHCPMPINTNQCWSKLWNFSQYWSIQFNADQFLSMLINEERNWSALIAIERNFRSITALISIDRHWALIEGVLYLDLNNNSLRIDTGQNVLWLDWMFYRIALAVIFLLSPLDFFIKLLICLHHGMIIFP